MAHAMLEPRFALGRVIATRMALDALADAGETPTHLLTRHSHGDWGDLHPDDALANERALRKGMRVLSAYALATGQHIWVITSGNRTVTRLMMADEYGRKRS